MSPSDVGVTFMDVSVWTDSVSAKRSTELSVIERGGWVDSSEGRMKSPDSTDDESAPPIT